MKSHKKLAINALSGLLAQILAMGVGLFLPRVFLTHYGSDINGLSSTIAQIIGYVCLLEAGVSFSARNILFSRIKDGDQKGISLILTSARSYFRKICFLYTAAIVAASFLVPLILKTDVDYWSVFGIFLFEGLTSAVSFYFVETYSCFLSAAGKSYIVNTFDSTSRVLVQAAKIILALFGVNIVILHVVGLSISGIRVILYKIYMQKKYGWINFKTDASSFRLPGRNAYLITEVTWAIFSSTDSILISTLCSTKDASVYSVYNLVTTSINNILTGVWSATSYKLGEAYVDNLDRYRETHDLFTSALLAITTTLMCVSLLLFAPFVRIYTDGVTDINYLVYGYPILFCAVQMLSWSRYVSSNIITLGGMVKQVSIVSIIEAVLNLSFSVLFIFLWGPIGALFGTVFSLPLKVIYCLVVSERTFLKRKPFKTILVFVVNYAVFGATALINHYYQINITNVGWFLLWGVVLTIGFGIILFFLNSIVNPKMLHIVRKLVRREQKNEGN